MILTIKDLQDATCGMCKEGVEHDHNEETPEYLIIHGRCHMGSPTWVRYKPGAATVEVICSICEAEVAQIHVGHGPS